MGYLGKTEKWMDGITALLWFIVILALLAMTVMGARCYRLAVREKERNDHIRETLSYLQSRADGSEAVSLDKSGEGDVLRFSEGDGAFETRIYVHDGSLVEELTQTDAPSAPEKGQAICSVESFSAEEMDGGGIRITVDGKLGFLSGGSSDE